MISFSWGPQTKGRGVVQRAEFRVPRALGEHGERGELQICRIQAPRGLALGLTKPLRRWLCSRCWVF